ncbi:MAG: hypothetical protein AB7L09_22050 [Nitrospira sp.]
MTVNLTPCIPEMVYYETFQLPDGEWVRRCKPVVYVSVDGRGNTHHWGWDDDLNLEDILEQDGVVDIRFKSDPEPDDDFWANGRMNSIEAKESRARRGREKVAEAGNPSGCPG